MSFRDFANALARVEPRGQVTNGRRWLAHRGASQAFPIVALDVNHQNELVVRLGTDVGWWFASHIEPIDDEARACLAEALMVLRR